MKNFKKVFMLMMVVVMLGCSINVSAATKTVTKSNDYVTVKLQYTSYKDSSGRKLVKNGKIISVKGKHGLLYLWEYIPNSYSLSLIDCGRTYVVKVKGKKVTNTLTQGQSILNYSTSLEFYYQ